ncbi:hypothetical protein, conserved [Eimeria necatrix]|uniref:Uncharacterized protein n=1 Tax=Eimeria necatrix TaxID=51315 RepID=U6MWN4_9EIME|nr:hypothetical protein, conserved [Eimeria necatrix]CDJ67423.1 hypothetical protein, conserved [Eimeria necatrix]
MESHLLQQLHDGLSQANNRRGRKGGLGGVASEKASQNNHIMFNEDGKPQSSSLACLLLTDTACSIIRAANDTQEAESDGESEAEAAAPAAAAAAAAAAAKSRSGKKSKRKRESVDDAGCTDTAPSESEAPARKQKKKTEPTTLCSSSASSPPLPSAATTPAALVAGCSLVRVQMQGGKASLRSHLQQAFPRCRVFLLVGGCGAVDVLLQRQTKTDGVEAAASAGVRAVKRKRLWALHLHGTCDLRSENAGGPSLSGIFRLPQAEDSECAELQVINAVFGSEDLLAGRSGVCEVWGFALDKRGACICPSA